MTKIFNSFFSGASKTLVKTLIPGTWRDPHEFGLWPIAQIVNPCTGEAKGHVDLGMDALVSVCSCNTNGIMIWSPFALGTRTEL